MKVRTFMLTTDKDGNLLTGTLTNEVNVNFADADGKVDQTFLTSGNDVINLKGGVATITDVFANDNDIVKTLAGDNIANSVTMKGIENLEIVNSGYRNAVQLNANNFAGLETIDLKGEGFQSGFSVADFSYGVAINATENDDLIVGGTKADTISGGNGNDTINAGSGNDVLTGGNGADTFVVGSVREFGVDKILDFSAEDKISVDGFAPKNLKKIDASTFSTVTYKTLDSVLATFATGGANATKDGDVVIFSYDGKTYALLAKGAFNEATDALVDITGANVASLTESNFGEFISQYNYASVAAFNKDAAQGLIPANTAIITEVGSGDVALKTTDIQYIKDGGILSIASGATVSIALQNGSGEKFDATSNDFVAKFASKVPALNITGTSGDDVIVASSFGGTIDGGSGNDTISLGAGKDTVVFAATAAANGEDTITGFKAGTGADADVLNFKETGGKGTGNIIAATGSGDLTAASDNIAIVSYAADISEIKFSSATVSSAKDVGLSTAGKYIIIADKDGDGQAGNIYLITTTTTFADTSTEMTVELLGTVMREGDSGDWDTANISVA